jgi:hypothetical protein
MDASTYLRRKKETMTQYIHKPTFMDAGLRTNVLGKIAGASHYVSPNTKVAPINPCDTANMGFTGSATATPVFVQPGCCVPPATGSIVKPCCDMIYEPEQYVQACKVVPYYGTPAQQSEAAALPCCNDQEVS